MNSDNAVNELTQTFKSIQEPDSLYLVEITISALTDGHPRYTLQEIYIALERSESWSIVDPLHLFPLLLPVRTDGAAELIQLIARNAHAKECMIAIQEAIENLDHSQRGSSDITLAEQLIRLLGASKECMIRLQFRKRGPAETFKPIFKHLESTVEFASLQVTKRDGRQILDQSNQLVCSISESVKWDQSESPTALFEILSDFMISILGALSSNICSSLSQRRFAIYYPRLVLDTNISQDALEGSGIMQNVVGTMRKLGLSLNSLDTRSHSLGKLILLAHEDPVIISKNDKTISNLIPLLTSSLRQNAAVDESLALLLTLLCSSTDVLSQEIVDPLATLLTPVSASHSDPMMRHIAFKLLSVTLARSPPPLRLAHLTSLLSDCPFTQMRVAAVALVKEAFLSASTANRVSLFSSPSLIHAVGPILFRPSPPDILENPSPKALETFIGSSESVRLTECLSFYYVWLTRDAKNLTGIRDRDRIRTIENGLLRPLKNALSVWSEVSSLSQEPHVLITLASLQISVERVESAILKL